MVVNFLKKFNYPSMAFCVIFANKPPKYNYFDRVNHRLYFLYFFFRVTLIVVLLLSDGC